MAAKDLVQKIEESFNRFNGSNFDVLDGFYATDVHFQDPAVDLAGLDDLKKYYRKMYRNVKSIRFDFKHFITSRNQVASQWTMTMSVRGLNGGKPFDVPGSSFFEFNEDGLVSSHRDYVDLSAMIYEKIPVVGPVVRALKGLALH